MSKPQFTFRNYLKELKKSRIVLVVFFILGVIAGSIYAFSKPTEYSAVSKLSVYNSRVNTGSATSPYSQIGDLLTSSELINQDNLSSYDVLEEPFGVFVITATSTDSQKAIDTANTVINNAPVVIDMAFDDADSYKVTYLIRASEANPTISTAKRIVTAAIVALAALALALIILFVKFDYSAQ